MGISLPVLGVPNLFGADATAPVLTIDSDAEAVVFEPFDIVITASEPVYGLTDADLDITNGTASGWTGGDGDMVFGATIHPVVSGLVTVGIQVGVCTDAAENPNVAPTPLVRTYAIVYGVFWDKSSSPTLTRTNAAVGMVAAAGVDSTPVTNDFDLAEIFGEITEVTDGAGNVFVRLRKCYIRKTNGTTQTWQISKIKWADDAYLPWCFWNFDTSTELDYVDVGKYVGSVSGGKLQSIAGVHPTIQKNIVEMRSYAQANGAGYQQLDIHIIDLLQTMFYIEFATLNSQSIMAGYTAGQYNAAHTATVAESGVNRIIVANATAALYEVGQAISVGTSLGGNQVFYGRTITSITVYDGLNKAINFDGAAVNIAIGNILYNTGLKNGFSSSIAATSGSVSSNSDGKHGFKYRGIENIWGNCWQFVDGININEHQAWVCLDARNYASNLFASPYVQLGYINHNADGWVTGMGFDATYPFAVLPIAVGGSAVTYFGDYYSRNTGQRIALLGGIWYIGSAAGLAYWYLPYASSAATLGVAGRLLRKAL